MKALILNNYLEKNPAKDEIDNLEETKAVERALKELKFEVFVVSFSFNLNKTINQIKKIKPDFVFNLVESVEGDGSLIYFATAILDYLKIPYTGNHTDAMYTTSNKIITKEILKNNKIKTPDWSRLNEAKSKNYLKKKRVIVKHVWEHASKNLDDDAIFYMKDNSKLEKALKKRKDSENYFVEEFIDGREFNISVIEESGKIKVLTPAEMCFVNYPKNKIKVVNYDAKWKEDSFEYKNTIRSFDFSKKDKKLIKSMEKICKKVWKIFNLNGFARVDFRVNKQGHPYVLEINANPCISPDGGFIAACKREGMNYKEIISKLIEEACIK
jgi:D-alanine-D-alanine ligase